MLLNVVADFGEERSIVWDILNVKLMYPFFRMIHLQISIHFFTNCAKLISAQPYIFGMTDIPISSNCSYFGKGFKMQLARIIVIFCWEKIIFVCLESNNEFQSPG